MEFNISPYVVAEPILLGMTSEQIEKITWIKARKFKKSPYSETLADDF